MLLDKKKIIKHQNFLQNRLSNFNVYLCDIFLDDFKRREQNQKNLNI